MGRRTEVRSDLYSKEGLLRLALTQKNNRASRRMLGIAHALGGMTVSAAARATASLSPRCAACRGSCKSDMVVEGLLDLQLAIAGGSLPRRFQFGGLFRLRLVNKRTQVRCGEACLPGRRRGFEWALLRFGARFAMGAPTK